MHFAISLTLFLQFGRTINKKEIRNYLANQPSHVQVTSMHIAISAPGSLQEDVLLPKSRQRCSAHCVRVGALEADRSGTSTHCRAPASLLQLVGCG